MKKQNKKQKFITKILNSKLVNILFMPLLLFYTITSIYIYLKESKIIRDTINSNDELTKTLLSMNFYKLRFLPIFKAKPTYSDYKLDVAAMKENLRYNFLLVLDKMIYNSDLLGVIHVSIKTDYKHRRFILLLHPSNLMVVKKNLTDLLISILLYSIVSVFILI